MIDPYTLNNIGSLKRTLQYNHHATPREPLLGLHGDSTEGFLLKSLYWLERMLSWQCLLILFLFCIIEIPSVHYGNAT